MDRLLTGSALLGLLLAPSLVAASDFDATIDLRGVIADGLPSYLNGGLGELRYDENHDGARLDSVRLGFHHDFLEIIHLNANAVSYADGDRSLVDLTEAYAEIRPFPVNGWRSRLKLGAFYAPISLENRLPGWRSAYTLSPSAINTWIGEEFRTFGAEYDLDWLGRQHGHDWEFGLTAAGYGWNDYSGELLAQRGWSINDRQTTLFGRIGEPYGAPISGLREFDSDVDHRVGYYAGGTAKYLDALELRVLHYDNDVNPNSYSYKFDMFGWHTHFNSAGVRWTPTDQWTVISQWLAGRTIDGDSGFNNSVRTDYYAFEFHSDFLLVSWRRRANRLSARYDEFEMHQTLSDGFFNNDRGHAWTFAYEREINSMFSVALEELLIDSSLAARPQIGEPVAALERELQFATRLQF